MPHGPVLCFVPSVHIWPMDILRWTMGHSDTSTSVPWATIHPPWFCLSSVPWTYCNRPWYILTLQPPSNGPLFILNGPVCLSPGHGAMDHGTFLHLNLRPMGHCPSPMVLSITHPMDMLQWTMGPSDTSTFMSWANMHAPWSCLLLCPLCPMGILQWALGPVNCSSSVPWATIHPPWSCLSSVPWDILTLQPLSHRPLYIPHGPACYLSHGHIVMDHGTFSHLSLCPMGHYPSPMVLSVICSMDIL
jgi:hypothetical protein